MTTDPVFLQKLNEQFLATKAEVVRLAEQHQELGSQLRLKQAELSSLLSLVNIHKGIKETEDFPAESRASIKMKTIELLHSRGNAPVSPRYVWKWLVKQPGYGNVASAAVGPTLYRGVAEGIFELVRRGEYRLARAYTVGPSSEGT